jgi:hypothetical protein
VDAKGGKGRVAFFMAGIVGCRVTGIDYSQKLIDIAKENRRTSRLGDRVTLRCCLAEQYEPQDENIRLLGRGAVRGNAEKDGAVVPQPNSRKCDYAPPGM